MKRIFAVVGSVSCLAFSAAYADGPFVLSDDEMAGVTAAGGVHFDTNVFKNVDINKTVHFNIDKNVATNVDLNGSLASAQGSADAVGFDFNFAETDAFAQVTTDHAFSFSEAVAAGNNVPAPPPPPNGNNGG